MNAFRIPLLFLFLFSYSIFARAESSVTLSGTVKDAVLESMQETNYGPPVCYGYLDVELSVSRDGGEARRSRQPEAWP